MPTIINDVQLDFDDVLIQPNPSDINSRKDVDITREYHFKYYPKTIRGTGIMAANMFATGNMATARVLQEHRMFTCLHKHFTYEQLESFLLENQKSKYGNDYIFISTGIRNEDYRKTCALLDKGLIDKICIDVPNGYVPAFISYIKQMRAKYPNILIMAGNVVTPEKTHEIIRSGADISKNNIGNGSACVTRLQTGVGRPTLSTILDTSISARQSGGLLCSDGGITQPADICKAFGAGSDFIMIGGMFAGANEANGQTVKKYIMSNEVEFDENNNPKPKIRIKEYKQFYGMSSEMAQNIHYNGMPSYRTSEGREMLIPCTGPLEDTIKKIEGGLRSMMTYIGAHTLDEIPNKTTFYKVRHQVNTSLADKSRTINL